MKDLIELLRRVDARANAAELAASVLFGELTERDPAAAARVVQRLKAASQEPMAPNAAHALRELSAHWLLVLRAHGHQPAE